ncbi:hypothetical protein [Marinobacterium arenosum]|uniref:hypothetical protein n=1 Tax=Marinobacterium arenosum TaxID=2862496 RepID=UPI001C94DBC3|nr:hypothetical protein [Marinobacterium arenosum]MBY4677336.1 hypothetical protein [Marinobacterium arenosum]
MKFVTEGDKVNCVRISTDPHTGKPVEAVVVSFDANVDRVAPHVAAELGPQEIAQLEQWLQERARLQAALADKPVEVAVLEALPGVLIEARQALATVDRLDGAVYSQIRETVRQLNEALDHFKQLTEGDQTVTRQMQSSEVLKQRLESIKKKI